MLTTGLHTAQSLSRDFHLAYCDIHDHVLTRFSLGKLAWLGLSQSRVRDAKAAEGRIHVFYDSSSEGAAHRSLPQDGDSFVE